MSKAALGKGLSALIGAPTPLARPEPDPEKNESIVLIPAGKIVPCPHQPRKIFRPEQLAELKESIRERGIIQPLIVRRVAGNFELIAGERRWRAASELNLATLPAIIRQATDREVLELALIENLQRADLSPMEEARAYVRLIEQFSMTQEEVGQKIGKSRVAVANSVRLLTLPETLRSWVESGDLSVGHAKVLLSLDKDEERLVAGEQVRRDNLTVRATERLVDTLRSNPRGARRLSGGGTSSPAPVSNDLERRLQQHLKTRVRLVGSVDEGKLELTYFSRSDLDRLLKVLGLPDE